MAWHAEVDMLNIDTTLTNITKRPFYSVLSFQGQRSGVFIISKERLIYIYLPVFYKQREKNGDLIGP